MKKTSGYLITRHVALPDAWTDIIAPIFCNYFGLRNLGPSDNDPGHAETVLLRSEPGDPNSEDSIATGNQTGASSPFTTVGWGSTRFIRDERVFAVKSSGAFPQVVVMTWVQ